MFLVFQIILNMNFPDVYCSNLRMKNLLSSSFFGQKGRRTVRTRCSSKSHSGMMLSSSVSAAVWKSLITASTNLLGYPTLVNFFLILTISVEKSEAILCALCSSPVIAFRLYRLGTLEDQKKSSLQFTRFFVHRRYCFTVYVRNSCIEEFTRILFYSVSNIWMV